MTKPWDATVRAIHWALSQECPSGLSILLPCPLAPINAWTFPAFQVVRSQVVRSCLSIVKENSRIATPSQENIWSNFLEETVEENGLFLEEKGIEQSSKLAKLLKNNFWRQVWYFLKPNHFFYFILKRKCTSKKHSLDTGSNKVNHSPTTSFSPPASISPLRPPARMQDSLFPLEEPFPLRPGQEFNDLFREMSSQAPPIIKAEHKNTKAVGKNRENSQRERESFRTTQIEQEVLSRP